MMFIIPAILIKQLHVSKKNKIKLSLVMFPGVLSVSPYHSTTRVSNQKLTVNSVIVISAVRVWLVVIGQWAADGSWAYNPMLCVENAEVASTLIALSVPALKPVFGNLFSHLTEYTSSHTRSRSAGGRLRTHSKHSKPMSGVGSNARDDRRLLNWSKSGNDDYEMMPSEVSVTRDAPGDSNPYKSPGIKVTNEIDISRASERAERPPSSQQTSRPSSRNT